MAQAFIADLHLTAERPEAIGLLQQFLEQAQGRIETLYILGDLFEYWVGDDGAEEPEFAPVISALRRATDAGLAIAVMHGNRDFLLGSDFAKRSGCRLLEDPTPLSLYGVPTILSHGDALCTDDHDYLALRTQMRDPLWQRRVLSRPLSERIAMAHALRHESGQATYAKDAAILDVNPGAVTALLDRHRALRLIHGHTHRPGIYPAASGSGQATRIVVGDWYEGSSILTVGPCGQKLTPVADFLGAVADVISGENE
ncbi:MAG TPA: UDP-2,3-diacylglucosamine diphosphatase [Acidiferrobacter sp.]|nr:UDP-2,3-diacylglucosamine diphosphatase [Acidiferrobacter sp.]